MTDGPLEFEAAAKGVPPLLPDHAPDPRHQVAGHDRTIPPKPVDPNVLYLDLGEAHAPPEPAARKVPVKPHVRRNPRRKETAMTTIVTTEETGHRALASTLLDLEASARTTDPETSHAAAKSVDVNPSMLAVLQAFQRKDEDDRAGIEDLAYLATEGFHDEALVEWITRRSLTVTYAESRIRTARKDLVRLGYLEPNGDRRTTVRGRQADVHVLTQAGREFRP